MKKKIASRLVCYVIAIMILILAINYLLQVEDSVTDFEKEASITLNQISVILEAQENNEVSNVFANIRVDGGDTIFAINRDSGIIVGSSDLNFVGHSSKTIGLDISTENIQAKSFSANIKGVDSICSFERYENIYLGVVQSKEEMKESIRYSMFLVLVYVSLVAIIFIGSVLFLIDKMFLKDFRKVLANLDSVNHGNLDVIIDVHSTEEFKTLSKNLNYMLKNMQNKTVKLSEVLENSGMEVGLYEYQEGMSRVLGTNKLKDLLKIDITETRRLLSDKQLFETKIKQIKRNVEDKDQHIYRVSKEIESYVKIQTFVDEQSEYGIIIDVTDEVLEKKKLQQLREHDDSTGFLNSKGFSKWMEVLEEEKDVLENAVIIRLDIDNLKSINDNFGYHKGDLAISNVVEVLNNIQVTNKLMARLGGDDFAVVLYGYEEKNQIDALIHKMRDEIKMLSIDLFSKEFKITLSAGYAYYGKEDKYRNILQLADNALLEAKNSGKAQMLEYCGE